MKTVTVKAEIEIPMTPNFLKCADGITIPIEAVDEEGLKQIGTQWTLDLINKAREKRKQKVVKS